MMQLQDTKIILFNYGGGMRGLVPAHMMSYLEERTGLAMTDMVDIFTGPSTGSILNAALNIPHPDEPTRPKYRARHMIKFYEREGKHIFPRDRFRDFRALIHDFNNRTMRIGKLQDLFRHGHYDPLYLGQALRRLYGETQLSQTLKSLIIPTYNIDDSTLRALKEIDESDDSPVHTKNNLINEGGYALWLKNMKGHNLLHTKPTPDVSLFDSVMGSTAAPTYFPCHSFQADLNDGHGNRTFTGIDGSIFDNPCISYHGAIRQHLHENTRVIMILFGTGYTLKSINKDQWNSYGNIGVVDPANDLPLINILFHAPESALIGSFYEQLGQDMFIFNKSLIHCDPDIRPSIQIDDASPENLKALKRFTHTMIEEQQKDLDRLCELLVSIHDARHKEAPAQAKDRRRFFRWFSK